MNAITINQVWVFFLLLILFLDFIGERTAFMGLTFICFSFVVGVVGVTRWLFAEE